MNSYIHERQSIPIAIPMKKTSSFDYNKELALNNNVIDPSKMTPPDDFMDKLMKRMDNYYSPTRSNLNNKTFF